MVIEVTREMIKLADEVNTPNEIINLAALNGAIGFVSATFILPLIQQPKWSVKARAAVTFIWSLLVGFVTAWATGDLDVANIAASILVVFTTAITFYHGFAQPSGIAPAIENATSPAGRKQPTDDPPA